MDIQETTFSIDAIGNRICSSWNKVNRANTNKPFDVVIIGAGMFGAHCADKLFRRDREKKLRILVLDAGPFFLPTHVNNLPLGWMRQDAVWGRPWTGEAPFVTDNNKNGLALCVGGRSLFWAGWAPKLTPEDLAKWPEDVRNFLNGPEGYDRTGTEIGAKPKTEFIEETDTFRILLKAFQDAQKKVSGVDLIERAPLAVMGSRPTSGIFAFDQYSSVTFLIDAISQDLRDSEDKDKPGARHLMLLPRAEVVRLNGDGKAVTSIDLEVSGDAKTLRLGPNTTVVLANGTIEATRLALANLGVGRQDSGGPRVGNFMTHMGNSTLVRIQREALGLGKPSQSENEIAAFMARGTAGGRRFHYQIVAAALQQDDQTPWNFMMRLIPDLDDLGRVIAGHDPKWMSVVFRGIGEMKGDLSLKPANSSRSSISLEPEGDRAYVRLSPSDEDNQLWNTMDKTAIDLAKQLAGSAKNIQYRWGNAWHNEEPPRPDHSDIGTTYHEGGTLFMGDAGKSITNTYGKFHNVENVYVAGPALFPTLGSANPSLTGLSLARRTADAILTAHGIKPPKPGQPPLVA